MINEITTKELTSLMSALKSSSFVGEASLLTSPQVKIIDIRSVEAYNGWQLQSETRGGHISGAKSLPAKWLKYIDWIEIVRPLLRFLRENSRK